MNAQIDTEKDGGPPDRLSVATDWFLRLRSEDADADDLAQLQHWLDEHPDNVAAYRTVSAAWRDVETHASAPQMVLDRRNALADAHQAAQRLPHNQKFAHKRGLFAVAASVVGVAILLGVGFWFASQPPSYATGLGERRTLTLEDGSIVTLDARTRMRVNYRDEERLVVLEQGQARFDIARDPSRAFRVQAGGQTVTALGTQFNVEIVQDAVLVTLIEGRIAVQRPKEAAVELAAGEGVHLRKDGSAAPIEKVDVDQAVAWQAGKLFLNHEPLTRAAERVNRYARQGITVDASVAQVKVSGVFNVGDAAAFIEAMTTYFPVKAEDGGAGRIHLTAK